MSTDPLYDYAKSMMDIHRPLKSQDANKLRDLERYLLIAKDAPGVDAFLKEIYDEQTLRKAQILCGSDFAFGDKVTVIKEITWWRNYLSQCPPVGIKGLVLGSHVDPKKRYFSDPEDYDGLIPVRFSSADLGYGLEEGDDADRKYTTYNVPNWSIAKIPTKRDRAKTS